jgi:hypothetical protein
MRRLSYFVTLACVAVFAIQAQAQTSKTRKQAKEFFRQGGPSSEASSASDKEFWLRLKPLYAKNTKDDDTLRDDAIEFINDSILLDYGEWELAKLNAEKDDLFKLGQRLIENGSKDPIVLCYYADELLRRGKGTEARAIAKRAVAAQKKSNYPNGIRILMLDRFYRASRVVVTPKTIDKARKNFVESGSDWFEWACDSPGNHRPAWKYFDDLIDIEPMYNASKSVKRARVDDLGDVAAKYEKVDNADPWIVEMLNGSFQNDLAWQIRGGGYASTVSKSDWKLFEEHEAKAAEHFTQAYKLNPDSPESSFEMIAIARNLEDQDTELDWFSRCIAAEVDFLPAYNRLLVYRSSRWGGDQDSMMSFSEFCLASDRYETLVPYIYLQGLHTVCRLEEITWQEILRRPKVFERAEKMLTRLAKHPSRSAESGLTKTQARLLSELLCLCLKIEEYEKASKLFEKLGDQVSAETMFNFGFHNYEYYRSRTYAYLEFFDELDAFRKTSMFAHENRTHSKDYHDFYADMLSKSKEPRAKLYYQSQVDRAQMELDFHDGKWVNLTFDPGFSNWSANSVNWTYESPTSAIASNQRQGAHMQMYHFGDFPGPKEVAAEVELVSKGSSSIGVGVTFGMMHGRKFGRLFWVDPLKNKRGFVSNGPNPQSWESESAPKPSELHVKFWEPEKFLFSTDGIPFQIKSDPDFLAESTHARFKLGIGEQFWSVDNGVVRFKNLRVKKLVGPPPAEAVDK